MHFPCPALEIGQFHSLGDIHRMSRTSICRWVRIVVNAVNTRLFQTEILWQESYKFFLWNGSFLTGKWSTSRFILYVSAKWPGNGHDLRLLQNSSLYCKMETLISLWISLRRLSIQVCRTNRITDSLTRDKQIKWALRILKEIFSCLNLSKTKTHIQLTCTFVLFCLYNITNNIRKVTLIMKQKLLVLVLCSL